VRSTSISSGVFGDVGLDEIPLFLDSADLLEATPALTLRLASSAKDGMVEYEAETTLELMVELTP